MTALDRIRRAKVRAVVAGEPGDQTPGDSGVTMQLSPDRERVRVALEHHLEGAAAAVGGAAELDRGLGVVVDDGAVHGAFMGRRDRAAHGG